MSSAAAHTLNRSAPPAGVMGRKALFTALTEAVSPESPHRILVVFGFEGLKEYLEVASPPAGDRLLEQLAGRLMDAVGEAGVVYEPRRGEFCALFEGGLAAVRTLLVLIPTELDEEARRFAVRSSLGISVLPVEANDPTYALALADRRLRALSGNLRPNNQQGSAAA